MVYCNGTSNEWTLCNDAPSGSDTPVEWDGCYCPEDENSRNVAFSAPGNIPGHLLLPASLGGTLSFYAGYSPSTVLKSKTTSTPASTPAVLVASQSTIATSASRSPSATGESQSATESQPIAAASSGQASAAATSTQLAAATSTGSVPHGLSTGAKVGIGIGAGLGGSVALVVIAAMAFYIRRLRRRQHREDCAKRPHSIMPSSGEYEYRPNSPGHLAPEKTPKLVSNTSRDRLSTVMGPDSTQRTWSRAISPELEGSIPKHSSMVSLRSQELSTDHSASITRRPVSEMPVGVHRAALLSNMAHPSYQPGKQVGNGMYEMPAHLPGSTFLE